MKFFNRAGPIRPEDHYHLNPLERFDFEDFLFLIEVKTILSSLRISRKNNHRLRNVRKIIIQQARDEGGNFIFIRKEWHLDGTAVCYSIGLRRSVRVKEAPDSVGSGSEKVWMRCPCAEIRTAL